MIEGKGTYIPIKILGVRGFPLVGPFRTKRELAIAERALSNRAALAPVKKRKQKP